MTSPVTPIASGTIATGETSDAFWVESKHRDASQFTLVATGTFASTVLTVHVSIDGETFFATSVSLSAAGAVNCTFRAKAYKIAATAGSGTGLSWAVF